MKITNGLLILALAALTYSCKDKKEQPEEVKQEESSETIKGETYAEISVKKGGQWEGRKYTGGNFENVQEVELPQQHTDHSFYIRYEGPGWENAQVGYRLYLDWRNAIDIFGKKVDTMVLPQVGQDNFDSYHDEAPWGMDILKAGKSLGIGSYGRFMNDSVAHFRTVANTRASVSNSEGVSQVNIEYSGWVTGTDTVDLSASLSIYPEDRFTKVVLDPSEALEGLTTGIVKFDNIELKEKTSENGEWGYIATYGAQTLVNDQDKLGMALFYKIEEVNDVIEGPHDHLVVFKASEEPVTYYFLGAWEQELNGITSEGEFYNNLDAKLQQLEAQGSLEK